MIKLNSLILTLTIAMSIVGSLQASVRAERIFAGYSNRVFSVDDAFPFKMYYPAGKEGLAEEIEKAIITSIPDIAGELGMYEADTIDVYLTVDEGDYFNLLKGHIPEWSAGFSECKRQILGLNVRGISLTPYPMKTVVKHELSHLLLAQRTSNVELPVWFMEGVAMMQAGQWSFSRRLNFIKGYWKGDVPFLKDLDDSFPEGREEAELAYSLSLLAVEFLFMRHPGDLPTLTAFVRDTGSFEKGFRLTFGITTSQFADLFHNYLEEK